jgi:hypothetical protein
VTIDWNEAVRSDPDQPVQMHVGNPDPDLVPFQVLQLPVPQRLLKRQVQREREHRHLRPVGNHLAWDSDYSPGYRANQLGERHHGLL